MSLRVAVIDSGVNLPEAATGVNLCGGKGWQDHLLHGTAVAATILSHAPGVELVAVKIFDRTLHASAKLITHALLWCAQNSIDIANLSLGATTPFPFAVPPNMTVVAAFDHYPGCLPGVTGVLPDRFLSHGVYRQSKQNGGELFYASPYPAALPGHPAARGLEGVSFAVANMSGILAAKGCKL